MQEYEFIFVVDALDDDHEEKVASLLDAFVGGHGRVTLVTVNLEGTDAVSAAQEAVAKLESVGVTVRRLYEDLVTRKQIATRTGVSPQAVGLWTRGQRQADNPFPDPHVLVGSGLWRWGEVNVWLRQNGHTHDDNMHPTAAESAHVNSWLHGQHLRVDFLWPGLGSSKTRGPFVTMQPIETQIASKWLDAPSASFELAC